MILIDSLREMSAGFTVLERRALARAVRSLKSKFSKTGAHDRRMIIMGVLGMYLGANAVSYSTLRKEPECLE